MRYLAIEEILDIVQKQVGIYDFLNESRLHYMMEALDAKFGGDELYPTLFQKAAVYAHHIIRGHVFLDGNKRTGLSCALRFLEVNGLKRPTGIDDEIIALGEGIADGSIEDIEAIAERLRGWFLRSAHSP